MPHFLGAWRNGQAEMELWEGPEWSNFRGVLQMPFGLTVRVTGVKDGCSS